MPTDMTRMVMGTLVLIIMVLVGLWIFRMVKKEIPTT